MGVLVFKHVRREGFPGKNITAVPLIAENVVDGALTPVCVTDFGFAARYAQVYPAGHPY